jgi:hypothetical protein
VPKKEFLMKMRMILTCSLVSATALSIACSSAAAQAEKVKPMFIKMVEVFGVRVYATNTTDSKKLLHAAAVLAQYLDNDEDGTPDNPKIVKAIVESKGAITMTNTQDEGQEIPRSQRPRGQDLYGEETIPNYREAGRFDGALEEILHMVTDNGWGGAYPEVFGRVPGTEIANAMDKARGGQFQDPPDTYPNGAWYTYDDDTCDYDCQNSEYIYWAFTSYLGAQDYPERLEEIGREWRLNSREKLRVGDPAVYAILSRPEYNFPKVTPDGTYDGGPLKIKPYIRGF